MIPLQRVRTTSAVVPTFRGEKKIEGELSLLTMQRDGEGKPSSSRWKRAKNQLKRESRNKCAYCEADTAVVAHGDVEHFRPKSVYWWLAYCLDNLLFACQICNQSYKSDNFPTFAAPMEPWGVDPAWTDEELADVAGSLAPDPLDGEPRYTLADFEAEFFAEEAELLDPYYEDPDAYLAWEADRTLREVRMVARQGDAWSERAVRAAEAYYGLNREELLRLRFDVYEDLELDVRMFRHLRSTNGPADLRQDLADAIRRATEAPRQFAGMARYFVFERWGLTEELDNP